MSTEQTACGNADAAQPDWEAWLQRHGGKLFYFAVHWQAEDPEDALQHTLVQTARAVAEGRCEPGDTSILRYAYTTLRNQLNRLHRESRQRRERETAWRREQCGVQSNAATEEECRNVEEALRKLPPEEAEIVVLHLWEEMNFQDIAELLGIHRTTVSSRYRKALTDIRKLLTHFQP